MIFDIDSRLFYIACQYTHKFAPWQAVTIQPGADGTGAIVSASDRGAATFLAFDPTGQADDHAAFIAGSDLLKVAKGIKSAKRSLRIDTDQLLARVTTHLKGSDKVVEAPAPMLSENPAPDLRLVMKRYLDARRQVPAGNAFARIDAKLLARACESFDQLSDSVIISTLEGAAPICLQGDKVDVMVLLMPQTADPLPPVPDWLNRWSQSGPEVDKSTYATSTL
jgi:hypothetical protein